MSEKFDRPELVELTTRIVEAFASHNSIDAGDLPALIDDVHAALGKISGEPVQKRLALPKPAVPINKSLTPDYLICLEDGKEFKSLKRHPSNPGVSPNLNLTRRGRETAKEVNNTIIKSAPSGACWSAPIWLPTGRTGVACRQAHSGRTGWCPKIESATADRRRYGSPVIRNTYQTAITRNDLNHQLIIVDSENRLSNSVTAMSAKKRPGIGAANEFSFRIAKSDHPGSSGGQLLPAVLSWAGPRQLAEQARKM